VGVPESEIQKAAEIEMKRRGALREVETMCQSGIRTANRPLQPGPARRLTARGDTYDQAQGLIAGDERLFLAPVEPLDAVLDAQRAGALGNRPFVNQLEWLPAAQILRAASAAFVLAQPPLHVFRNARVKAAVGAAQYVNPVLCPVHGPHRQRGQTSITRLRGAADEYIAENPEKSVLDSNLVLRCIRIRQYDLRYSAERPRRLVKG